MRSPSYNVWHIASEGRVSPILQGVPRGQARYVADVLQELDYQGIFPGGLYMAVEAGHDADWVREAESSDIDYMQVYEQYQEQMRAAVYLRYGSARYDDEGEEEA